VLKKAIILTIGHWPILTLVYALLTLTIKYSNKSIAHGWFMHALTNVNK